MGGGGTTNKRIVSFGKDSFHILWWPKSEANFIMAIGWPFFYKLFLKVSLYFLIKMNFTLKNLTENSNYN